MAMGFSTRKHTTRLRARGRDQRGSDDDVLQAGWHWQGAQHRNFLQSFPLLKPRPLPPSRPSPVSAVVFHEHTPINPKYMLKAFQKLFDSNGRKMRQRDERKLKALRQSLATINEMVERSNKVAADQQAAIDKSKADKTKNPQEMKHHWSKGTGFGNADRKTAHHWNIQQFHKEQSEKKQSLQQSSSAMLKAMKDALTSNEQVQEKASDELKKSHALEFLVSHLNNDSVVDLERDTPLYSVLVECCQCFCKSNATTPMLLEPVKTAGGDICLYSILKVLYDQSDKIEKREARLLKKLKDSQVAKGDTPETLTKKIVFEFARIERSVKPLLKAQESTESDMKIAEDESDGTKKEQSTSQDEDSTHDSDSDEGENKNSTSDSDANVVAKPEDAEEPAEVVFSEHPFGDKNIPIAPPILKSYTVKPDAPVPAEDKKPAPMTEEERKLQIALDRKYNEAMKPLQFDEVAEFSKQKYDAQSKNMTLNRKFIRRVTSEYSSLSESLPLCFSSSIYFRAHEENMALAQMMIAAPEDTPYGGGLFLFDIFLPAAYPNQAPQVNLQTTGGGSVRFNPNLYNCGKVCLSLLGTWGGDASESWDPKHSTLLQVGVSIQSLIFVPEPYFNEPGYERQMGTPNGKTNSDNYNKRIEAATLKWAMLDMLKNPPKGFEEIVKNHFKLRGPSILKQCRAWQTQKGRSLTAQIDELEKELAKL